jgi:hypothetical protein
MRELNNPGAIVDDYGNQAGTGGEHRFFLVFPTPICVQFWDPPVVKSNASTSASSSTRSGRSATVRHCKSRYACTQFALLISLRIRLYVSSSDFGNSSRVRRRLAGKQCRRTSNWQKTHRNLCEGVRQRDDHDESNALTFHPLSLSVSQ